MNKTYRYKIYPTQEQKVLLNKTFGCVRVVWNKNVAAFNSYDKETNPSPTYPTSTEIRSEYEWMKEVSAATLQQKEIDFRAFRKNYFSKSRKTKIGRCPFKHKNSKQSFRLPNQKFTLGNHKIRLEKMGWVVCKMERRPQKGCKFMSVTVTKDKCGKFFVSVLVQEDVKHLPQTGRGVGVDLGLKDFAITSDGEKFANPRFFRESQARLRKAQKNLSRKKKDSVRFRKGKIKVARIHSKITNQRKWFHHQISNYLVKTYDFIGFEDLNVKGMIKNRRLSKSISDAGWSQFISFVKYKSDWYGKQEVEIDRFYPSSKTCSECGWIKEDLKLFDREFVCEGCGCVLDRDENAALNIFHEALRIFTAQGVACA